MAQQLLWIETLLKLSGGTVLLLAPWTASRTLGLPAGESTFWPRLLGALLVALAGATYVEGKGGGPRGLGLGGLVVINLLSASWLIAALVLRAAAQTVRGKLICWLTAAVLVVLALFELPHA